MTMFPLAFLTIHCAATPEGRDVKAATILRWGEERFGQPSYHWVVELGGACVRTLPDDRRGAHVAGRNSRNIGICYVGGLDADGEAKDTRTLPQKAALRRLVARYRKAWPGIQVLGHRDHPGVARACPSFDVESEFGEIGL